MPVGNYPLWKILKTKKEKPNIQLRTSCSFWTKIFDKSPLIFFSHFQIVELDQKLVFKTTFWKTASKSGFQNHFLVSKSGSRKRFFFENPFFLSMFKSVLGNTFWLKSGFQNHFLFIPIQKGKKAIVFPFFDTHHSKISLC